MNRLQDQPGTKRGLFRGAWLALALFLALSFAVDIAALGHSGSVDFRNRITGARLLAHGIDPYHYIWHPGDPAEFCDIRNNPNMTVSKTTVPPAFLVAYLPLAELPYRAAQFLWLLAQWALLLGALGLWARAAPNAWCALLMGAFVAGLSYTTAWRWEAERGQCYTLVLFLFAWWLTLARADSVGRTFFAGLLAGLLIALRPPLMLAPFLALHRRAQLPGLAAGLALGIGLPMLFHPAIWLEYAGAMQTNSHYYRHASLPPRPDQAFPPIIEGTPTSLLGSMAGYPFLDLTVYAISRRLGLAPLSANVLLAVTGLLVAGWLWLTRRHPFRLLLPGLAAWLFLVDFVLPTTRWEYYDILVANVVLAGIATAGRWPRAAWPCLLALVAAWTLEFSPHLPPAVLYLPASLLALGALWFLMPPAGAPKES